DLRKSGLPQEARQGHPLHHPLHGRGRAPLRPHRGDGPRPGDRRRHPGRPAARPSRRPRPRGCVPGPHRAHPPRLMPLVALAAIVAKALRLFLTDRRALTMSFAAPIVIASFFGAIFSSVHGMAERARMAVYVVERDRSPIARAIVTALQDDRNLNVTVGGADEAWTAVRRGAAVAAVIIPPGFGDDAGRAFFGREAKPELKFLYDPSHAAELAMVRGIVTEHVMRAISRELWAGHLTLPYEIREQPVTAGAGTSYNS